MLTLGILSLASNSFIGSLIESFSSKVKSIIILNVESSESLNLQYPCGNNVKVFSVPLMDKSHLINELLSYVETDYCIIVDSFSTVSEGLIDGIFKLVENGKIRDADIWEARAFKVFYGNRSRWDMDFEPLIINKRVIFEGAFKIRPGADVKIGRIKEGWIEKNYANISTIVADAQFLGREYFAKGLTVSGTTLASSVMRILFQNFLKGTLFSKEGLLRTSYYLALEVLSFIEMLKLEQVAKPPIITS